MHKHPGITVRHRVGCRAPEGGNCNCKPAYLAWVYDKRTKSKHRATFDNLSEAKSWRAARQTGINRGTAATPSRRTLAEEANAWLEGAKAGAILGRGNKPYKPSVLRVYGNDLNEYILNDRAEKDAALLPSDLGKMQLGQIRKLHVVELAERLRGKGLSPSKVRNVVVALRVVFRRAVQMEIIAANPCDGISLPKSEGKRDRVATLAEAAQLLDALPEEQRPLWATALYSGLRRGELRGLRWDDVDLKENKIHVRRGWDDYEGEIAPKSDAGVRTVGIPKMLLRPLLLEHKARTGRRGSDLVFGRTASEPFTSTHIRKQALDTWAKAKLEPIGLHECRHSFATVMIAAMARSENGVNAKDLSVLMGHSSITITYDLYGHLLPESQTRAADALDALSAAEG